MALPRKLFRKKSRKYLFLLAEGVGFEPTVRFRTTDFESVTFGRSDTPPKTLQKVKNLLLVF